MQDCGNSSANALELPQSCSKPMKCYLSSHSYNSVDLQVAFGWSGRPGFWSALGCIWTLPPDKMTSTDQGLFFLSQCRSGSTLAQVMACCLMTPSHYLNWCWLNIKGLLKLSPQSNLAKKNFIRKTCSENTLLKLLPLARSQRVNLTSHPW